MRTHNRIYFSTLLFLLLFPKNNLCETTIVFRYDDFAGDIPGSREKYPILMDIWQAEQFVDSLFKMYNFQYTIAVIPNKIATYNDYKVNGEFISISEDSEKIAFLKKGIQENRIEIALHGYTHKINVPLNHKISEFRERGYESQLQDLTLGKEILTKSLGITNIELFVPPWNSWDKNTAKALSVLDFSLLSADRSFYYETAKTLTIIPFTAQLWELEAMIKNKNVLEGKTIVILYHPYQLIKISEKEDEYFGINRFSLLLHNLSKIENVKVGTFEALTKMSSDFSNDRYHSAYTLWRLRYFWSKLLPKNFLPGEKDRTEYLTKKEYSGYIAIWSLVTIAFLGLIIFIGFLTKCLLRRIIPGKFYVAIDILAVFILILSIVSVILLINRGYHITAIRVIPAFFFSSFLRINILINAKKDNALLS